MIFGISSLISAKVQLPSLNLKLLTLQTWGGKGNSGGNCYVIVTIADNTTLIHFMNAGIRTCSYLAG